MDLGPSPPFTPCFALRYGECSDRAVQPNPTAIRSHWPIAPADVGSDLFPAEGDFTSSTRTLVPSGQGAPGGSFTTPFLMVPVILINQRFVSRDITAAGVLAQPKTTVAAAWATA
jgi:hypothetical protein